MGYRRIPKEIKDEILRKVRAGRTVKEVAEEHGVKSQSVYNWLEKEPKVGGKSETLELSRLRRENEALMKLLGRLTYETELARRLGVSRSSLYYERKMETRNEDLRTRIEAVIRQHPGYGHRRIALALNVNHKAVSRVMRLYQLRPARRCKAPMKGRDVGVPDAGYPDIVQFMSPVEPLVVWTGDFSFIPFKGRFIYLCVVRDHFTSEVLGQSMRLRHDSDLVVSAFRYAVERAGQAPSWFHSDQGSEYIGRDFDDELARHGVQRSTSPKRSPWRNGAQESFFGRMKVEFGDFERFDTLGKLVEATARYIAYYNDHRIHTTLGTTPVAFREQWYRKHADLHASVFRMRDDPSSGGGVIPHTTEEKYI